LAVTGGDRRFEGERTMGMISRDWHEQHNMPANPTEQQRAEWHHGHAFNGDCHKVTPRTAMRTK
jgi:hypothetical protein